MSENVQIWLSDAEKTQNAGASLVGTIYTLPLTLWLSGNLGAGKTTFLQGLAKGIGIERTVTSPTYALEQRHRGFLPDGTEVEMLHIDLFRLSPEDAKDLVFSSESFEGIRSIEWADRLEDFEKEPGIHIRLETPEIPDKGRRLHARFLDMRLPSESDIRAWQEETRVPANVIEHCAKVRDVAEVCAETLLKRTIFVRKEALSKACLLHDLLRFIDFKNDRMHHGLHGPLSDEQQRTFREWKKRYEGQSHEEAITSFLREQGYEELAAIVAVHGLKMPSPSRLLIEQKILYYADKRVRFDTVVTLEERFEDFMHRYGGGRMSKEQEYWFEEAKRIERELFPEGPPI